MIINSIQGNLWKDNSIPDSRDAIKKELEDLVSEGSSSAVEKVEWENIFKELNAFGYQEWLQAMYIIKQLMPECLKEFEENYSLIILK